MSVVLMSNCRLVAGKLLACLLDIDWEFVAGDSLVNEVCKKPMNDIRAKRPADETRWIL